MLRGGFFLFGKPLLHGRDEAPVRRAEVILRQLGRRSPFQRAVLQCARLRERFCLIERQMDAEVRIVEHQLVHARPDADLCTKLLAAFARQRLLARLAGLELSAGEFPLPFTTLTRCLA